MSIGFAKLMESQSIFVEHDDAQWQRPGGGEDGELARVLKRSSPTFAARRLHRSADQARLRREPQRTQGQRLPRNVAPCGREQALRRRHCRSSSAGRSSACGEGVSIVDATTGQRYEATGKDGAISADFMDDRRKKEEHYTQKIRGHLSYIRGVLVGVFAELETEARRTEERKPAIR